MTRLHTSTEAVWSEGLPDERSHTAAAPHVVTRLWSITGTTVGRLWSSSLSFVFGREDSSRVSWRMATRTRNQETTASSKLASPRMAAAQGDSDATMADFMTPMVAGRRAD